MSAADEVIDRLAILELTGRYADRADQRDWAGLAAMFLPDAVFDAETVYGASYEGADAIRQFYETAPLAISHHPTGVFSTFNPDGSARTRIKMLVLYRKFAFTVDYDLDLIKEGEEWKIARLKITMVGRAALAAAGPRPTEAGSDA